MTIDELSIIPLYNFNYIRILIVDLFCDSNNMRLYNLLSDMHLPETQWRKYFNLNCWNSNFLNVYIKLPNLIFSINFFQYF